MDDSAKRLMSTRKHYSDCNMVPVLELLFLARVSTSTYAQAFDPEVFGCLMLSPFIQHHRDSLQMEWEPVLLAP